jgi:hypothetical protein
VRGVCPRRIDRLLKQSDEHQRLERPRPLHRTPKPSDVGIFRDAAPLVRYEVDSSDALVTVNEAWSTFAVANGAPHLIAGCVIGRSLWDFITDDRTRRVYRSLLEGVRQGARRQFLFRGDSPQRRRFMQMTLSASIGGHVVFESVTLGVQRCAPVAVPALDPTTTPLRMCDWCRRVDGPHGCREYDGILPMAQAGRSSRVTYAMCPPCYTRVLHSLDADVVKPHVLPPVA